MTTTAAIIIAALLSWNPGGKLGARSTTPDEVLAEWGTAIADACNLEEDGRKLTTLECLTLAGIPSEETHFAPHILDGSCNIQRWRALHHQDKICDGGKAYGVFQVWPQAWASVAPVGGKENPSERDPFVNALVARRLLLKHPHGWMTYDVAHAKAVAWLAAHP
jgi:hypothetical protein